MKPRSRTPPPHLLSYSGKYVVGMPYVVAQVTRGHYYYYLKMLGHADIQGGQPETHKGTLTAADHTQ